MLPANFCRTKLTEYIYLINFTYVPLLRKLESNNGFLVRTKPSSQVLHSSRKVQPYNDCKNPRLVWERNQWQQLLMHAFVGACKEN